MTERDAWADIYRLYEKFAPALRQAATLDDDNDKVCSLLSAAIKETAAKCQGAPSECRLLLMAGYDILVEVAKAARA